MLEIYLLVTRVVKCGEEHGCGVDEGLRVQSVPHCENDGREEEQVTQGEEESVADELEMAIRLLRVIAGPAPVARAAPAAGHHVDPLV